MITEVDLTKDVLSKLTPDDLNWGYLAPEVGPHELTESATKEYTFHFYY